MILEKGSCKDNKNLSDMHPCKIKSAVRVWHITNTSALRVKLRALSSLGGPSKWDRAGAVLARRKGMMLLEQSLGKCSLQWTGCKGRPLRAWGIVARRWIRLWSEEMLECCGASEALSSSRPSWRARAALICSEIREGGDIPQQCLARRKECQIAGSKGTGASCWKVWRR